MTDSTGREALEAAELRGRLRGRWKAGRRVHEHEALHEHRTSRDLVDALREAMDRGDEVRVDLMGARPLTGRIVAVGRDYVAVRPAGPTGSERHVRLPVDGAFGPQLCIEILGPGEPNTSEVSAAVSTAEEPPTFQAVLQQYDFHQQTDPLRTVELGTTLRPDGVRCTLLAHAGDHLVVRLPEGSEVLLPDAIVTHIAWAGLER